MKLVDFNVGHAMSVLIHLRPDDWEQVIAFGGTQDIDAAIVSCALFQGPKWAFIDEQTANSHAVMVGGFIPQRAGVYRTWFLASAPGWKLYGKELTEVAAERLNFMIEGGAHRIETVCLASRKRAQKWYETIGLKFESTLEGYCVDGSDAVMFVKTNKLGSGGANVL